MRVIDDLLFKGYGYEDQRETSRLVMTTESEEGKEIRIIKAVSRKFYVKALVRKANPMSFTMICDQRKNVLVREEAGGPVGEVRHRRSIEIDLPSS